MAALAPVILPPLDVLNESLVPEQFITIRIERRVNKEAIKAALQAGDVEATQIGVRLVTDKQTVVAR